MALTRALRNRLGITIIEIVTTMSISLVSVLAMTSVYVYAIDRASVIMGRIKVEENIAMAGFYLRYIMGQAVRTKCYRNAGVLAPIPIGAGGFSLSPVNGALPPINTCKNPLTYTVACVPPLMEPEGVVDCRNTIAYPAAQWNATAYNPLGIFMREIGGKPSFVGVPYSRYEATGIYFVPGTATRHGILVVSRGDPGGIVSSTSNFIFLDKFVDIRPEGATQESPLPYGRLQTVTYRIRARYWTRNPVDPATGYAIPKDYSPNPPNDGHVDLDQVVNVGLKDNWLGYNFIGGGTGTSERLHGAIYFFQMKIPRMSDL